MLASIASRLARSTLLQRAPAADALRRPLVARSIMSSAKQHAHLKPESPSQQATMDEIQLKKEELYDLISLTETSIHTNWNNRILLRSLSAQIKPRLRDTQWDLIRASKRRSDVIRPVGIVLGFSIGVFALLLMRGLDAFRTEKEISQNASYQGSNASYQGSTREMAAKAKHDLASSKGEGAASCFSY